MLPPATTSERRVALAAVAGAHGVSGEIRLKLFAANLDNLKPGATLFVGGAPMRLTSIKPAGKAPIARFDGVADRSAAEALRSALVELDRSALPPLGEGEYYHADLIGLPCADAGGTVHGTVVAVENYGAGDLLEVEREGGHRALIPFRDPIAVLEGDRVLIDPDFLA